MTDFKAIETQEDLDRILKDRLNRQKESYEQKLADYEELSKQNTEFQKEISNLKTAFEGAKTNASEYDTKIEELNKTISDYQTREMKTSIAIQNGLPIDLANRLVGTDEESLRADAERLVGFMKPNNPPVPLKNVEDNAMDSKHSAYQSLLNNLDLEGE